MKTTIDLPDDLVRDLKLRAVIERRTLRDLVTDFIRQGLGRHAPQEPPSPRPAVMRAANGLPVIRCADGAPAAAMSVGDLLALERSALALEDVGRVRRSL